MDKQQIKAVFSDEAFVMEFLALETPEEVQAALKEKDIDMTESEIVDLRDEIIKQAQKAEEDGALSLDQLDEAAGGVAPALIMVTATTLVAVSVVGTAAAAAGIGLAIGGIAKGIGSLFQNRRW